MATATLASSDRQEFWESLGDDGYSRSLDWPADKEDPSAEEIPVPVPTREPIRQYLREISRVPLLTRAQEADLGRRIENGRRETHLILSAIPFAAQELESRKAEDSCGELLGKLKQIERDLGQLEALPRDRQRSGRLRALERQIGLPRRRFRELLERAVEHDEAVRRARQELIEANLRLVVAIAKRYPQHGLPLPDLIQHGNLGLMKAVDRFDYRRGFKFSTYAIWWIRQALTHAIVDFGRTVRLPQHVVEALRRLEKTKRTLFEQLHREPTGSEIAERMGIPVEKLHPLLNVGRRPASLDTRSGDDVEFGESIVVADRPTAEDMLLRREQRLQVNRALRLLPNREREVVRLRFGIGTDHSYTLDEIGQRFSLTRERIRQIEAMTLANLRQTLKSQSGLAQGAGRPFRQRQTCERRGFAEAA